MVKWVKWVQCPESYNLEAPISICAQAMQNGWLWSESFQAWDNFIVKRRKGRNMHGKFFNCHDGRILSSDSWLKRRWAQFLYISSVFSMPWDSGTICSKWFRMVSIDGNGHETKLHQTSSHCSMFSFAFVFCVQYLSCQEVGCASLQATKKENNWSITTILQFLSQYNNILQLQKHIAIPAAWFGGTRGRFEVHSVYTEFWGVQAQFPLFLCKAMTNVPLGPGGLHLSF